MVLGVNAQFVKRRTPTRMNVGAFAGAVEMMHRNHQMCQSSKQEILESLSEIDLNPMENEWKANYITNVAKRIDNVIDKTNSADALQEINKIGQEVMASPALVARYNANQDYNEFKKYVISKNKGKNYISLEDCKIAIAESCKKYNVNIFRLETNDGNYPELGDNLYMYSLVILDKPRSYRNWLYLLYLSAKCGNDDAINQAKDYQLMQDKLMIKDHSTNLFIANY